jgi:hypothetical protein
MKSAVRNAKLGRDEEMQALKRLDDQARRLERTAEGPAFESFVATERTYADGKRTWRSPRRQVRRVRISKSKWTQSQARGQGSGWQDPDQIRLSHGRLQKSPRSRERHQAIRLNIRVWR